MNNTPDPTPQQVDQWLERQPHDATLPPANQGMGWPTVIGIIAIVFGACGILGGILGMLGPAINKVMIEVLPADQAGSFEAQTKYQWWLAGLSLLATFIALWLLLGGIGVLKKRPAGAGKIKIWAIIKIVFVIVMVGCQVVIQRHMFDQMQAQQAGQALPSIFNFTDIIVFLSLGFGLLWGLALPVFMLIWFGRRTIKDEVQTWDTASIRPKV